MDGKKAPGKKRGRKPKSREVREGLLDNLRTGMSIKAAYTQAGISERTYYNWISDSEEWAEEVEAAIRFSEAILLAKLNRCAEIKEDWRAYAWRLSRRFPKEYGDQKQVDLNVAKQSDGSSEVMAMLKQIEALHGESEPTSPPTGVESGEVESVQPSES